MVTFSYHYFQIFVELHEMNLVMKNNIYYYYYNKSIIIFFTRSHKFVLISLLVFEKNIEYRTICIMKRFSQFLMIYIKIFSYNLIV